VCGTVFRRTGREISDRLLHPVRISLHALRAADVRLPGRASVASQGLTDHVPHKVVDLRLVPEPDLRLGGVDVHVDEKRIDIDEHERDWMPVAHDQVLVCSYRAWVSDAFFTYLSLI